MYFITFGLLSFFRLHECNVDVMVNASEMKNLFFGPRDDIKIMENGHESDILKNNLTSYLPPIKPEIEELSIKFASSKKLHYKVTFHTSDQDIMSTPTMEFPYDGRLKTDYMEFRIHFPCSKRKTGIATLGITIDFSYDNLHKKKYKTVNLSMRRLCQADNKNTNPGCKKECSLYNLRRKYCLSDFVSRVKIIKATDTHYIARVPLNGTFKKPCLVPIVNKNQYIKIRSSPSVSCSCQRLEVGKKYLLFAREDFIDNVIFVDDYSLAYEIIKRDKNVKKMLKDFRSTYLSTRCPSPTVYEYYCKKNSQHQQGP